MKNSEIIAMAMQTALAELDKAWADYKKEPTNKVAERRFKEADGRVEDLRQLQMNPNLDYEYHSKSVYFGVAIRDTHEKLLTESLKTRHDAEMKIHEMETYDKLCERFEPNRYCIVATVYED